MTSLEKLCIKVVANHLHLYPTLYPLPPWIAEQIINERGQGKLTAADMPLLLETTKSALMTDHLEFINLRGCSSVSDEGFMHVFMNCPFLTQVDLSFCDGLTDTSIANIARYLPQIQVLDLTGCSKITDEGCATLQRMTTLTTLRLELCSKITDMGVQKIARNCVLLKNLNLGGVKNLSNISVQIIADHCTQLESLNLGGNPQIMDIDMEDISKKLNNLTSLNLRACWRLTDSCLKYLALLLKRKKAKGFPALVELDLGGCGRITDQGMGLVVDLLPDLEILDLRGCKLMSPTFLDEIASKLKKLRKFTRPVIKPAAAAPS